MLIVAGSQLVMTVWPSSYQGNILKWVYSGAIGSFSGVITAVMIPGLDPSSREPEKKELPMCCSSTKPKNLMCRDRKII